MYPFSILHWDTITILFSWSSLASSGKVYSWMWMHFYKNKIKFTERIQHFVSNWNPTCNVAIIQLSLHQLCCQESLSTFFTKETDCILGVPKISPALQEKGYRNSYLLNALKCQSGLVKLFFVVSSNVHRTI